MSEITIKKISSAKTLTLFKHEYERATMHPATEKEDAKIICPGCGKVNLYASVLEIYQRGMFGVDWTILYAKCKNKKCNQRWFMSDVINHDGYDDGNNK